MRDYQIITDTNSDLPSTFVDAHGLLQVPQYTLLEGVTYEGAIGIEPEYFYQKMAEGVEPKSQAINPAVTEECFRKALELGRDVLYISFASTLSGSCDTATMVGNQLKEEFPEAEILVIDSMNASLSEGLLVMKAMKMQSQGASIHQVADWIEEYKLHMIMLFTVDDLHHLQRGGRVSKTTALVGSLINVKPIMNISDEGKIVPAGTVRGRKKSIATLVEIMESKITDQWKEYNDTVAIMHGNCFEDAKKLSDQVKVVLPEAKVIINDINPSIGVHSGPGALMLSFFGAGR